MVHSENGGKLYGILTSRKFLATVVAVLLALFGLDISPEVQAAFIGVVTAVFVFSTALEDGLSRNGARPIHITSLLDDLISADEDDEDRDRDGGW
jgi:hypothetical protein